jgi:DNA-directed RNA polymerase specialized sigma24 family protein
VRGTGAAPEPGEAEIGRIFRAESGRSVAALIRVFGDIDVAEDAVREAFAIAATKWPGDGLPPNPGGWITTTARNRAIDRLRRESRGWELLSEVAVLSPGASDPGMTVRPGVSRVAAGKHLEHTRREEDPGRGAGGSRTDARRMGLRAWAGPPQAGRVRGSGIFRELTPEVTS